MRIGGAAREGSRRGRRGTVLVEMAVVSPLVLLILIGIVVVGLGVFRRMQLSCIARDASRWASVHGATYTTEQGGAAMSSVAVYTNAVAPRLGGMHASDVTCAYSGALGVSTVTLTYRWNPCAFFSPVTFTSQSSTPTTY